MDQTFAPDVWMSDIGGGIALHCAACHPLVLACPDNAQVEFDRVPLRMIAADRVCEVCERPFHGWRVYASVSGLS